MTASRRLEPLQTLAAAREDAVARRMRELQQRLAEQETRLEEVRRYLRDYAALPGGGQAALLVNRQAFLARLQEAERQQARAVEDLRLAVEAERTKWLLQRRDVSVLDQLAACYRREENRAEARREQRSNDELALGGYFRRLREDAA